MTDEELNKLVETQRHYNALVAWFSEHGDMPSDKASRSAGDLHDRIMGILNGKEPDPSQ